MRRPDDLHLHIRDGALLTTLGRDMPLLVKRAIIMPNLVPPVTTTEMALAYRERVLASLPSESTLQPLMTLYLTDNTTGAEIRKAYATGKVFAVKLYPAGATTNSDSGVTDIDLCKEPLAAMAEIGMPLLVHGEVTTSDTDIFDREAVFLERHMRKLVTNNPTLKVVMEHITTKAACDFVKSCGPNVAATITAHHLLYTRSAIFNKGLRPHMVCSCPARTHARTHMLIYMLIPIHSLCICLLSLSPAFTPPPRPPPFAISTTRPFSSRSCSFSRDWNTRTPVRYIRRFMH